jgi:polyhydroxyalkanoate synthesis regulator phasin
MAQAPDWKQMIEAGMAFTEMQRSQARRIASDLLAQGQIARDQVSSTVDELVDLSRRRREELTSIVRNELQRQLGSLGLATREDLGRLERRMAALANAAPAARKATAKRAPAQPAATKATAKKATATKAPAKQKATGASKATKASTGAGRAAARGA